MLSSLSLTNHLPFTSPPSPYLSSTIHLTSSPSGKKEIMYLRVLWKSTWEIKLWNKELMNFGVYNMILGNQCREIFRHMFREAISGNFGPKKLPWPTSSSWLFLTICLSLAHVWPLQLDAITFLSVRKQLPMYIQQQRKLMLTSKGKVMPMLLNNLQTKHNKGSTYMQSLIYEHRMR